MKFFTPSIVTPTCTCQLSFLLASGVVRQTRSHEHSLFSLLSLSSRQYPTALPFLSHPPVPERVAHLLFLSKVIFCVERPILSLMVSLRLDILAEEDTDTSKGRPIVGRTRMLIDRLRSLFPL